MSQDRYEKDFGMMDRAREQSGIYKLGFELPSFLGLMLPGAIVIGVGGILGLLIWQVL